MWHLVKELTFKFPGARYKLAPVSYSGFDKASRGLKAAIDVLDERKLLVEQNKNEGLGKPDFIRYLVVLDEWNLLYGGGEGYADIISKNVAKSMLADVQRLLSESAFVNITLILIGQSPLSGDNGLSRPQMENASRITINKTAIRWLNDKDFPNPEMKVPFKKQINEWQSKKLRCALVVPMVGDPFCELIPDIDLNAFSSSENVKPQQHQEIVSDENTIQDSLVEFDPLKEMIAWALRIFDEKGELPNDATFIAAWVIRLAVGSVSMS